MKRGQRRARRCHFDCKCISNAEPSVALGEEGSAALTAFRLPSASSRARHTFPRELDERASTRLPWTLGDVPELLSLLVWREDGIEGASVHACSVSL